MQVRGEGLHILIAQIDYSVLQPAQSAPCTDSCFVMQEDVSDEEHAAAFGTASEDEYSVADEEGDDDGFDPHVHPLSLSFHRALSVSRVLSSPRLSRLSRLSCSRSLSIDAKCSGNLTSRMPVVGKCDGCQKDLTELTLEFELEAQDLIFCWSRSFTLLRPSCPSRPQSCSSCSSR